MSSWLRLTPGGTISSIRSRRTLANVSPWTSFRPLGAGLAGFCVERALSWLSCWRRPQARWDREAGRVLRVDAAGLRAYVLSPELAFHCEGVADPSRSHQASQLSVEQGRVVATATPGLAAWSGRPRSAAQQSTCRGRSAGGAER